MCVVTVVYTHIFNVYVFHFLVTYSCRLLHYIKGTGKLFDVGSRKCQAKLEGHEGDVSKVMFYVIRH